MKLFSLDLRGRGEGGNIVFNGIKGVGKTTLLHVYGAITSCLGKNTLPIYWIYEKEHSSSASLSCLSPYALYFFTLSLLYDNENVDIAKVLSKPETFIESGIISSHFSPEVSNSYVEYYNRAIKNNRCLFLLDEFTTLYTKHQVGISVISDIKRIARKGDTLILLAASCFNVSKYIFPTHEMSSGPSAATSISSYTSATPSATNYPDLNNSLFFVREIRPLRKLPEIIAYFQKRYNQNINETVAGKIFQYTGGIGRYMHQYFTDESFPIVHADIARLVNSKEAILVFGRLSISSISSVEKLDYANKEFYDYWMDNSILYEEDNNVTLLFPITRVQLENYFNSDQDLMNAFIFKLQRIGFKGGSTGHSNEDFLCSYLHNITELGLTDSRSFFLTAYSQNVHNIVDNEGIGQDISPPQILSFLGHSSRQLFHWKLDGAETGIDRFWWIFNAETNHLQIYGAQIKTGKDILSIKPGKLSTQSSKTLATDCDDTTIAGIIIKAEMGFSKLIPILSSFVNSNDVGCHITLSVEALYIITNKHAETSFSEHWKREKSNEVHKVTLTRKIENSSIKFESFSCVLIDGTNWLREVIPERLLL